MNLSRLLRIVGSIALVCLFILAVSTSGVAKGKKGGGKPPGPPTPPPSTKKVIESVNQATSMVMIKDEGAGTVQAYTIDSFTVITVDDVPGKFENLKTGMEVTDYVERDAHTLDSISVTGKGGKGGNGAKSGGKKKKSSVSN